MFFFETWFDFVPVADYPRKPTKHSLQTANFEGRQIKCVLKKSCSKITRGRGRGLVYWNVHRGGRRPNPSLFCPYRSFSYRDFKELCVTNNRSESVHFSS